MAPTSTPLTNTVTTGSPYQLNSEQVLKASSALLKHMKSTSAATEKHTLVDEDPFETEPIWLSLTTKTHIISETRLKPIKIPLPHPINTSSALTICLITADPQSSAKDLIAHHTFPQALAARITRVIGLSKLKTKWSQYEALRKLYSEHDLFLADDRIVTSLPKIMGKTFYKSTAKRPVPVSIEDRKAKTEERPTKKARGEPARGLAKPVAVAKEIEKALACAVVYLSASTNTAVRVGLANWTPNQVQENVQTVTNALIEKSVPKKWRSVKSVHLKGRETASLPIWLADELWTDENDILNEAQVKEIAEAAVEKKRKSRGLEIGSQKAGKNNKKQKLLPESSDDKLDAEIAARKDKLKKQKNEAVKALEDEVPKPSKKDYDQTRSKDAKKVKREKITIVTI